MNKYIKQLKNGNKHCISATAAVNGTLIGRNNNRKCFLGQLQKFYLPA